MRCLVAVVIGVGLLGSARGADEPPRPERAFAAESFWYTPLPAEVPLAANSAELAAEFGRQKKAYYGTVSINTRQYAAPVYVVGPEVKPVAVAWWNCQNKKWREDKLIEQWQTVPIPDYAEPADGTDAEMVVWQPSTDTLWEFWKAKRENGQWAACWGGRMERVSQSLGIWTRPYGTTATGLPFMGGQLSVEELRRGEINHVMGISLVDLANWEVVSWPANRSDGYNPDKEPNRIAEGQRFRLDPAVDVEQLNLHPVGKMIARAAQRYGFVVWDKAGAITLRADNPKAWTLRGLPNPYEELFAGSPAWKIMQGIPWERLQFLPLDYGKPGAVAGQ